MQHGLMGLSVAALEIPLLICVEKKRNDLSTFSQGSLQITQTENLLLGVKHFTWIISFYHMGDLVPIPFCR